MSKKTTKIIVWIMLFLMIASVAASIIVPILESTK